MSENKGFKEFWDSIKDGFTITSNELANVKSDAIDTARKQVAEAIFFNSPERENKEKNLHAAYDQTWDMQPMGTDDDLTRGQMLDDVRYICEELAKFKKIEKQAGDVQERPDTSITEAQQHKVGEITKDTLFAYANSRGLFEKRDDRIATSGIKSLLKPDAAIDVHALADLRKDLCRDILDMSRNWYIQGTTIPFDIANNESATRRGIALYKHLGIDEYTAASYTTQDITSIRNALAQMQMGSLEKVAAQPGGNSQIR